MENQKHSLDQILISNGINMPAGLSKESAFKTKAGLVISEILIDHIVRTEPFQRWDECLQEIWDKLARRKREETGIAADALLLAELRNDLDIEIAKCRYNVSINDEQEVLV